MTDVESSLDRAPERGRLVGRSLFLSASVPSGARRKRYYERVPDAQIEIEQAVIAVARAVFAEGGRLVFGGHPSISPLVAMVAGEYAGGVRESGLRAPAVIHQLTVFRGEIPDATRQMEALGQARIVWHEPVENEIGTVWDEGEPRWLRSLTRMRRTMLGADDPATQPPDAMVCIGGMEGVEEEASIFVESSRAPGRRPRRIYAFARTGGAASLLTDPEHMDTVLPAVSPWVRAIDEEVVRRLGDRPTGDVPLRYVPYPLIAQLIVREVAG